MKTTDNRFCHNCGIEFTPRNSRQIFCSAECWKAKMHPTQPINIKNCLWCHQKFTPLKMGGATQQKFCCCDCRNAFYSERQRIFNQYFFENAKMHEEIDKLEKEGNSYVMS